MSLDTNRIDKANERNLAQAFLTAAKRFYEDPENARKFEEWKRQKEARQ
ncbi:MAG: hypothetical protein J6E41_00020 [Lachnospiraceae bacterium]|nr:hypothetical protein [Lachnospiraceae bacterium]